MPDFIYDIYGDLTNTIWHILKLTVRLPYFAGQIFFAQCDEEASQSFRKLTKINMPKIWMCAVI